ncbi:hypothetical protein SAMN02787074_3960 [Chryseobacterium sp. YR221]|nr:hypothetical protein SAMN02787074_3960 [Chryseobacterium sp. YR221]
MSHFFIVHMSLFVMMPVSRIYIMFHVKYISVIFFLSKHGLVFLRCNCLDNIVLWFCSGEDVIFLTLYFSDFIGNFITL